MADNLDITVGNGSAQHRSHDTGDVHTPIHKIALGATNADETIVDAGRQIAAESIPVVQPLETSVFQTIAELASSSISGSFASVGSLTAGTRIFSLVNTTTVVLVFSMNGGTNPHRKTMPMSKENIDLGTNALISNASVYVKADSTLPGSSNGAASIEGISA